MSKTKTHDSETWSKYATVYDPTKVGSIDGKTNNRINCLSVFHLTLCIGKGTEAHDKGIIRAINSKYKPNERVLGEARHTIFIGRLHIKTDEVFLLFIFKLNIHSQFLIQDKLRRSFRHFGKILRCRVVSVYSILFI